LPPPVFQLTCPSEGHYPIRGMIDGTTLGGLYDRHSRELFVYICGFTRDPQAAEDLLHDTFERLIRYSMKYPLDLGNIRAFLYRTARNLCIDRSRRRPEREASAISDNHPAAGGGPHEELERRELREQVRSLVDAKDPLTRSVYLMRTELDRPYEDIAEALGISVRTAKRKMQAMLEYLADALEKLGYTILLLILLALLAASFVV
jgi:RNA polymerase sigma factor (sigma-70 family)